MYASYFSGAFASGAADTVQRAIWWLEDEVGGSESDWLTLAGTTTNFDVTGWDIKAVNLIYYDGADNAVDVQSQLVGE